MEKPADTVMARGEGLAFQYPDSTVDTTYHIRDLVRGIAYRVDDLDEFLILRSDSAILDTVSTFGIQCGTYGHTITAFDSTFLVYEAVCRSNSGSGRSEVWCVVDGRFKFAAAFESHESNPMYGGEYLVTHRFQRRPYRLRLAESLETPPIEEYALSGSHWELTYQLRFDTTGHFFFSDSIDLLEVSVRGGNRVLNGRFPAIATMRGTWIHLDNRWYHFSEGKNFGPDDEEAFIRGKWKQVLSGRGIDGDSLWP